MADTQEDSPKLVANLDYLVHFWPALAKGQDCFKKQNQTETGLGIKNIHRTELYRLKGVKITVIINVL